MRIVVVNDLKSKIPALSESMNLRLGYVLGEEVCTAGTAYVLIEEEDFHKQLGLEAKMLLLDDEELKKEEGEQRIDFREMLAAYKTIRKIKSKSKQDIVMMKQTERTAEAMFNEYMQAQHTQSRGAGMIQLKPIFSEDHFICYRTHWEDEEKEDENFHPLSKILMGDFPLNKDGRELSDAPSIFFLTFEFCTPPFYESVMEAQKKDRNSFVHWSLTFPNLNLCSAQELQAIRSQLSSALTPWRNKMNEWIGLFSSGKGDTQKFYEQEVKPAGMSVKSEIENNVLLRHISNVQNHEVTIQVMVGSILLSTLWEYYRFFNVAQDAAWEKLVKAKEQNPAYDHPIPIMVVRVPGEIAPPSTGVEEAEVKAVKKHLDI